MHVTASCDPDTELLHACVYRLTIASLCDQTLSFFHVFCLSAYPSCLVLWACRL